MTEWLVRKFVKNHDDVENPRVRTAYGTFASIVCIACNIVLCAAKGAIGAVAGSVAIVADALNNLSDASSNIISLFGFKLASKPPDAEHPYGHGRFEYLSGLAVAVLILVIGVELVRSSFDKIIHPEPVEFSIALVAVLVLSIVVKLWMAAFNKSLGTRISSSTLLATAADSRNDVIATAAVLICTLIAEFGGVNLDGWAGLAVGAFIVYSGIELVRDTVDPLLGKAPDPAFVKHIYDKIVSYPGVLDTHDLIVHDYGPGRLMISLHAEVPGDGDIYALHDAIDTAEYELQQKLGCSAVIHMDPVSPDGTKTAHMREELADMLRRAGYAVTEVTDFADVTGQLLALAPDLVLLDLNLPEVSGFQICRDLKRRSALPVLVLTSRDQLRDEVHALELGADEYLTKPYRKERLLARIGNVLKRYEGRPNLLEGADFLLDRQTYTLYIHNQSVVLPPNQGKLLETLLAHGGQTATKDDLSRALWGTTEFIDENALQVNLTRLKKTMASLGMCQQLVSVRGVGYRLEVPHEA